MLLTSTVQYINHNIMPGISSLVVVGLTARAIVEIQKSREQDDSLKVAILKSKKYVTLAIIAVVLSSIVYTLASYYRL